MRSRRASLHVWLSIWFVICALVLTSLACSMSSGSEDASPVGGAAPLVLLIAPVNNSVIAEGATVELYALAQDMQDRVARLEFRIDDIPVPDDPVLKREEGKLAAHSQWVARGQSKHVLTVEAFRADGLTLGMTDIVITVVAPPGGGSAPAAASAAAAESSATTAVPTPTGAPQIDMGILDGIPARVDVANLNVRQGPGTEYPSVGTLAEGDTVQIVGRNADHRWWAIAFRGGSAWVFADLVTPQDDTSRVPLVASP